VDNRGIWLHWHPARQGYRYENVCDVPMAGLLTGLPALCANGLLSGVGKHLSLPKGFYSAQHSLLLLGFVALGESLLVGNISDIIEKMVSLKGRRIDFSLDDFGTGHSSLGYLSRLPLDQLKIDKSLVNDVLTNPDDAAIAKTIIALAHSLRLGVIAEGVETDAQREFLADASCHAYQGYLFGRPLPVAEFEAFVRSH